MAQVFLSITENAAAEPERAPRRHHSFKGTVGCAKLVAQLPGTSEQVAKRVGCAWKNVVARSMSDLHRLGLIYRYAVVYTGPKRTAGSVWAFGRAPSVPLPARRLDAKARPSNSAIGLAMLVRSMYEGPKSTADLVRETGLNKGCVLRVLRVLKDGGLVHVAEWEKRQGSPIPFYAMGRNMPDAEMPMGKRRAAAQSGVPCSVWQLGQM